MHWRRCCNNDGIITVADIKQINHYYPFGMNMEGNWNGAAGSNKYQYNGKEWNDDFGLGLNDYGARFYDPAVARWTAVDPLSEIYGSSTPYHYGMNNPILYIDPTGMASEAANTGMMRNDESTSYERFTDNNQKAINGYAQSDVATSITPYGYRTQDSKTGEVIKDVLEGWNINCGCGGQGEPPCPSVHNGNLLEDIKNGFSYSLRALGWMTKETATKVDKEVFDGAGADLNNGQYKKAGTSIVMSLLFSRMKYLKPLWTATSKLNSVKNAYLHWKKHQSDFPEFINAKQYVEGALQFLQNSPVGTLVKMRPNGDVLKYHPATNTFGVMDASGIPRTMFRPTDGINYWLTQ